MTNTPWTDIETSDKAADAQGTANLAMALRDDLSHCREFYYDPDRHVPDGAHAHRGDESAHLGNITPTLPNLLTQPLASEDSTWHRSDVTLTPRGFAFATGGQWVASVIGDASRPSRSVSMFGGGASLVIAGYFISNGAPVAGEMQMGLINGGNDDADEKEFLTGTRVDIPAVMVTTTWRRFWTVIDTRGVEFSNSIRFCVQCSADINDEGVSVFADLFDVRPGRVLDYVVPGYVTSGSRLGWQVFENMKDWGAWGYAPAGAGPPPLDHAIGITNAIKLAAR